MNGRQKAALLAAGAVILVGAAAVVTYMETRQHERDRHALLRHASEMERAIRARGERIWLHVESRHEWRKHGSADSSHQRDASVPGDRPDGPSQTAEPVVTRPPIVEPGSPSEGDR